jgi:hypothetical protein
VAVTKLASVLDQIDSGTILLPEFQRGYVWNRDQVRGLMRSLYRGYPVGGLLLWETAADTAAVRGSSTGAGQRLLLLDGQQRITSLYGVVRGRPPAFFEGDPTAFTGLRFNIEDETFEFYAPAKMKGDVRWVDVTELFLRGLKPQIEILNGDPSTVGDIVTYLTRLTQLHALVNHEFHEEKITGSDKTVEVVVDIFNRVNSGGTKLSQGDLALARTCAAWPEARAAMRELLADWATAGYQLSLDWLLRSTNAVATGRAPFSALSDVDAETFQTSLTVAGKATGTLLEAIRGRLGLDHNRVLMGRYAVPVMVRYLHLFGQAGQFATHTERDKLLYWYVQSALWGRFAGSTETVLAQDYETLERSGIDGLIAGLERWRGGNLRVEPHDFEGIGRGSRFYPLLYLMTRVGSAQDFGSGLPLHSQMLGHLSSLQVHHVFPKAYLYEHGFLRGEVNAIPNFCFLTQQTNIAIGKRAPEEYFAEVEEKHPGALASQWIPADPALWSVDRYRDFLHLRRELLAEAANTFLDGLRSGLAPSSNSLLTVLPPPMERDVDDPRAEAVSAAIVELSTMGCVAPEVDTEIADPVHGTVLAAAEAYWPDGLQPGLGSPVVLELDPDRADLDRLTELGIEVFTTIESLRRHVHHRNRVSAGDEAADDPHRALA